MSLANRIMDALFDGSGVVKVPDGKKTMTLSIRLLREGWKVDDALREEHELDEVDAKNSRLFIGQALAMPPNWLGFIDEYLCATAKCEGRACSMDLTQCF